MPLYVTIFFIAASARANDETLWVDQSTQNRSSDGSPTSPFSTIAAAAKVAKPGTVIQVLGGVYREQVVMPAGEKERPIRLRSADGHKVVISGASKITDWKEVSASVFEASLPEEPVVVVRNGRSLRPASFPKDGGW